jgi:hypothetical protein
MGEVSRYRFERNPSRLVLFVSTDLGSDDDEHQNHITKSKRKKKYRELLNQICSVAFCLLEYDNRTSQSHFIAICMSMICLGRGSSIMEIIAF